MALQAPAKDNLLAEFEELIDRIGKEVAEKSLSPTLKELMTTWQAGVDNHQQYMAQLVTRFVDKTTHVEETLSQTHALCKQLDSLAVSMGEEWRSSVAKLAAGYNEVIEKTDIPFFLRTLSEELKQYQKLRADLEEAYRQLGEVCQLLSREMQSYRSLVYDNMARTKAMLDSGIQDLKRSNQTVGEHMSLLRDEMHKLCADIRQEVDKSLEDASSKYSRIHAQQEQAETNLLALLESVRSLEMRQKTSLESFLDAINNLAAGQRRIAHRMAVTAWAGIGGLLAATAFLAYVVIR